MADDNGVREQLTEALRGHYSVRIESWLEGSTIVARHVCAACGERFADIAAHLVDVLLALDDVAIIELPTVAHKGPHDTDAKFFRQVADRLEDGRGGELGGSNVLRAVCQLLLAAARAAERDT